MIFDPVNKSLMLQIILKLDLPQYCGEEISGAGQILTANTRGRTWTVQGTSGQDKVFTGEWNGGCQIWGEKTKGKPYKFSAGIQNWYCTLIVCSHSPLSFHFFVPSQMWMWYIVLVTLVHPSFRHTLVKFLV